MPILNTNNVTTFNVLAIHKGDFIRLKYSSWTSSINAIVTNVSYDEITALYISPINGLANYVSIRVESVANGLWTLTWSTDLLTVQSISDGEENDS